MKDKEKIPKKIYKFNTEAVIAFVNAKGGSSYIGVIQDMKKDKKLRDEIGKWIDENYV